MYNRGLHHELNRAEGCINRQQQDPLGAAHFALGEGGHGHGEAPARYAQRLAWRSFRGREWKALRFAVRSCKACEQKQAWWQRH